MITISTTISAPIEKVWACWNEPKHITQWNFAIDTWCCPSAESDLRVGGKLKSRMEAKDGSIGFDFEATYTAVIENQKVEMALEDGRKVEVTFEVSEDQVTVTERFDPESENPEDMQRQGWQAILDNFKRYVEASS